VETAAFVVAGYLCGSLTFGYWLVRIFRGEDIRTKGSGNVGATNVWRVYGRWYGLPVVLFDGLKGFVPALVATQVDSHLAGVLAGGVWLGQGMGVGGTEDGETLQGTSAAGAHLAVQVTDTEGGLRLVATVDGMQDGEACWLVVHTKDGRTFTAGSWRAHEGEVTLAGAAMVRAGDVARVSVVDHHRQPLVTAN